MSSYHPNPQAVFRAAIKAGHLSENPGLNNFAGHYMYMYHDDQGRVCFKHSLTREYLAPMHLEVLA